ncbi:DJ-1/PfpI family protein [Oleispirillum naphthae]|uniref:DJ-1/PfpI family protein n=1 Tax=Oleispirillum naphthae TaxID=2838853 RepID=UPI0030822C2E
MNKPLSIVFLVFDGLTPLDFVGPFEVLYRLPGAVTRIVSLEGGAIAAAGGRLRLSADAAIAEVEAADILVVPGGPGAREMMNDPRITAWVRAIAGTARWVASVCTGSLILGGAGLLKGVDATTHWAAKDLLAKWGANPVNARIVERGRILTAAGVSAGIDMALLLAARLAGDEVAKAIQLRIEYDPQPPFDCGSPEKAGREIMLIARDLTG